MLTTELNHVLAGKSFTDRDMEDIMTQLASGEESEAQIGALLAALRMKGETVAEITGAARFLRRVGVFIDCGSLETLDTCGTGGDGLATFNISTTAAFVAAGAGVTVAKHGNRSVSSRCGSADLLAELGYNLEATPEDMEESIQSDGIGFLFAQRLHPVLGKLAGLRRSLGVRTIFNLLGPLANPAGSTRQLTGVYDAAYTERLATAMRNLGVRQAMVVHGHDGLDEISINTPTRISELKDGAVRTYELQPELYADDFGPAGPIAGGTPAENAATTRAILDGTDRGPNRSIVLLNAGAAIYVAGKAADLHEGIRRAAESIDTGRAAAKLQALIRNSRHD